MTNFFVPQRHMVGSLLPRYDIRNIEHFVYLLNEKLEALVRGYSNAYILDVDRISASFGRRYIQDDSVYAVNHGAVLGTPGIDASRIEPMAPMADHYEIRWFPVLSDAIWAEALSMHRIARQRDAVKLVITDLDDTLWSGVSGDMDDLAKVLDPVWVLGLIETLMVLKQRGILLAIASKNDEKRIREVWPKIFGNRLSLEDFAAIRINWRPKAENIQEMLSVLNLLPGSAVFIDDNPAERASVQQAFPNMRVLGRYPYYLRRILLWSSETQVASISEESRRRTEMAQTQFLREASRERMSRGDFLAQASPKVEIAWLTGVGDPRFARAFELINKTNQFNTTGHRWKHEDMARFLGGGGRALIFNVQDAFTNYGLVGVVLVKDAVIEQWVMSCRVIGYDIEQAVMSVIVQALRGANAIAVTGVLVETEANLACRSLFENAHFRRMQTGWVLEASELLTIPSHITLVQTP
jgi:FkbH-like protein